MHDSSAAFTIAFPEARKTRTASTLATVFFLMFWILWGVDLFGAPSVPELPWFTIALIPFALFLGFSIYGWRKQRELAPLLNRRFEEEFAAHTQEEYPPDVDILKVRRSIAVKRPDGSVCLWA
ncbi:hypothetical protein NicSoilB4_15500 [Arthrobacter sp. NicSoilB4]|nr:hypothetical protein NicSoilB4_15500 [Arthrobacter sp. NicSoilB4]